MLNEVKHLAIAREILRCAQNDIVHHLTCDRALRQFEHNRNIDKKLCKYAPRHPCVPLWHYFYSLRSYLLP
jgi:hypothetical protein